MNYEAIRKRLAALGACLSPHEKVVSVELPDGTRKKMSAAEWWDHHRDLKLSDFENQDNAGGLVVFLVLAALADESIDAAGGDPAEVARLTEERDAMLKLYFRDGTS